MGSSLILKPQAPTMISSNSTPSIYSSGRVGFLRSELFGGDYNVRPPDGRLNSRAKCGKVKLKSDSRRRKFICGASVDLQPTVVFPAVATFSALTVVFFSYSKKRLDFVQMSGQLIIALSEQLRSMTAWILTDAQSIGGRKDLIKEITANGHIDKDLATEFVFRETETYHGGSLITDESTSQSNVITSSHDLVTCKTSESNELPTVSSNFSYPSLSNEIYEVNGDKYASINNASDDLSAPEIQASSCASSSAVNLPEKPMKFGVNLEVLKGNDISRHNLYLSYSTRQELHKIDKASLEKLDILELLPTCTDNQKNNAYLRPTNKSLVKGSNILIHTEKTEGKLPIGFNQSFFCQKKDSRKRKGLNNEEKAIFNQDNLQKLPPFSNPKGNPMKDNHNPPWQLRVYNQLLREGRLIDCIELLEDLEEKGLLDMDKVYHLRFFDTCKNQKAVKEAFRFIRLIPNPTLSTFNMLMSVCSSSQDSEGAFEVMRYVQEAGLKADCKLYTTLISTYAKSGKVDTMFKVFHEMVNNGVEPNVHTYGALIDGCAKAGQVAKAFGAYGILRSKNVKPDRVVFNALITACGQSGAVDRAFDVLAEMRTELQPIDPDHVTIGSLMKACACSDQVDRAREVYNMIHEYGIKGTAELYTIAVNSCSHRGDWEFACSVYDDMLRKDVAPDEMFISALIDVAGHAGKVDAAFEILQEARSKGMPVGLISYSSLMGACTNAREWQKALELYEGVKGLNLKPTVPMMNALITALCDADQYSMAIEMFFEMKSMRLCPNIITYSVLVVASERKDDLESGLMLLSEAKKDGVALNLVMCRCLLAMCLCRFHKACKFGDSVLTFTSGRLQIDSKWTSMALMVYRETIISGVTPTMDELSLVLGCLQLPHDVSVRNKLVQNLGVSIGSSKGENIYSFIDGFGEFDPRAISLVEEAASLGVVPFASLNESPIVIDARNFKVHMAEVYLLTILKGLKHRVAAGARLPNVTILLPIKNTQIKTKVGEKTINIAGRISQSVAGSLRRLGIAYQGNESFGKIRINGVSIRRWFQPKFESPFTRTTTHLNSPLLHLSSGIAHQQRKIRTGHLSLE